MEFFVGFSHVPSWSCFWLYPTRSRRWTLYQNDDGARTCFWCVPKVSDFPCQATVFESAGAEREGVAKGSQRKCIFICKNTTRILRGKSPNSLNHERRHDNFQLLYRALQCINSGKLFKKGELNYGKRRPSRLNRNLMHSAHWSKRTTDYSNF